MTTIVFGASGPIGQFLLPRLQQEDRAVLALSRQARAPAGAARWLQGELPDAVPPLPQAQAMVCLGPLDHFSTWLERAEIAGHPRIVAMSSMSAESKRAAPLAAERELSTRLRAAEARLATRCRQRGLRWTILRATLIYGGGSDRSITPLARRAMRWRVFPLPAGKGLRQPVHAQDLAAAVFAALGSDAADDCVLEIGGGERLTATRMFARVRGSLPGWTVPMPLPRPVLRLAARMSPRHRGAIARLDQDLVADNRELTARLGVRPRRFMPGSSMAGSARPARRL